MKILRVSIQLIFLTLLIFRMLNCSNQKADLVFKGGVIHTVDDANPTAQAIAIAGDKILAVGSNSEIETLIGQDTRVVDLAGKTMVPGDSSVVRVSQNGPSRPFQSGLRSCGEPGPLT